MTEKTIPSSVCDAYPFPSHDFSQPATRCLFWGMETLPAFSRLLGDNVQRGVNFFFIFAWTANFTANSWNSGKSEVEAKTER